MGTNSLVHIYAGGQRIARESWGSVSFEHHNPVTGSWLRSHGHSSYRTTDRQERDAGQAEIPLSNPYTYAGNYVDMKFGEPLFIEGTDPFDYVRGVLVDGMPISQSQLASMLGKAGGNPARLFEVWQGVRVPDTSNKAGVWPIGAGAVYLPKPERPQNTGRQIVPLGNLRKGLEDLLKGDCGVFVQKLIDKANELYGGGRPHATSFWDAFSRIQDAGGYQLNDVPNGGTVSGELFVGELVNPSLPEDPQAGPGTVHITPFGPIGRPARPAEAALAQARYAYKALHETLHLAKRGWYYDEDLARASHAVDGTTAPEYRKDDTLNWSKDFDTVLQRHCAYPFK